MRYAAAHKPILLKAKLTAGLVQNVKFEITDKAGKKVAESEKLTLTAGKAEWNWTPNAGDVKTLPDEEDQIELGTRIFWYNPDGSESGGYEYLDGVTVFRDEMKIKVLTEANAAVIDANVRIVVERPGALTRNQKLSAEPATAEGEVTFTGIEQWTSIGVIVGGAWVLQNAAAPWKATKDKGLNREVTVVPKKYKAAFKGMARAGSSGFDPIAELGDTRVQYVNFLQNQEVPRLGENETASHYCHRVQLRVGPEATPTDFANEPIFVMFEAGENNSKRNSPKPGLTGQGKTADATGILELRLNSRGLAECELELGYAGGDTFTLKVCSVKDFSGTVDQTLTIENWRKLLYELIAPTVMTAALTQTVLPASAGEGPHYDFPTEARDWITQTLDPVFIKYELAKSYIFANDRSIHDSQFQPAAHFGRDEVRNLYIGSFDTRNPEGLDLPAREPHTIRIRLFDIYYETRINDVRAYPILTTQEANVPASGTGRHFLPNNRALMSRTAAGGGLVTAATWEAVIPSPATYANPSGTLPRFRHPGLDQNGGVLKGTLPATAFTATAYNNVKVTLPVGSVPAALAGAESADKCPIKVSCTLREAQTSGGGYADKKSGGEYGFQVANLSPRKDVTAFLISHEVGHAINMTIMKVADVPPGLTAPKTVDETDGTYYRNRQPGDTEETLGIRSPGQGEHCAKGLTATEMEAEVYATNTPAEGCVMFGFAPSKTSTVRTAPILFCEVCMEYAKAQDLSTLQ